MALLTGTLTYPQAFSAFGNDTIWLILGAFFFAKVGRWAAGCHRGTHVHVIACTRGPLVLLDQLGERGRGGL